MIWQWILVIFMLIMMIGSTISSSYSAIQIKRKKYDEAHKSAMYTAILSSLLILLLIGLMVAMGRSDDKSLPKISLKKD